MMSRSVSFLRRINFTEPSSGSALWIKRADLYEDDSRIYAFLTFSSNGRSNVERCKIRITPFDKDKFGMEPFGVRILSLGLKAGQTKEHPDPLILPKGTYAFNFALLSYSAKKGKESLASPAAASLASSEPALAPSSPSGEPSAPSFAEEPIRKSKANKTRFIKRLPILLPILLILLGLLIGFCLLYGSPFGATWQTRNFYY